MEKLCTLQIERYGQAVLLVGRYPSDGAIALCVNLIDGQPLCTFTTNLKSYGAPLADDEFHVNNWDNEEVVEDIMATGLFDDTGKRWQSGYVSAPVWRFKDAAKAPPLLAAESTGQGGQR